MPDVKFEDETDWENYESGPFCRHWCEAWVCDLRCNNCDHECVDHDPNSDECVKPGCGCKKWEDAK